LKTLSKYKICRCKNRKRVHLYICWCWSDEKELLLCFFLMYFMD